MKPSVGLYYTYNAIENWLQAWLDSPQMHQWEYAWYQMGHALHEYFMEDDFVGALIGGLQELADDFHDLNMYYANLDWDLLRAAPDAEYLSVSNAR